MLYITCAASALVCVLQFTQVVPFFFKIGGNFFLYFRSRLTLKFQRPFAVRKGKGFGIASIRSIAAKYGGSVQMRWDESEKVFDCMVTLSVWSAMITQVF